jgi:hypothetical protein
MYLQQPVKIGCWRPLSLLHRKTTFLRFPWYQTGVRYLFCFIKSHLWVSMEIAYSSRNRKSSAAPLKTPKNCLIAHFAFSFV